MRVVLSSPAYPDLDAGKGFWERGKWPAHWIGCPGVDRPPLMVAFRRRFTLPEARTVRVHVTADQRYILHLDGQRIGRGSERGDLNWWFYESYDLELGAGEHTLVALVWGLGDGGTIDGGSVAPDGVRMPVAQFSLTPGCFLLSPDDTGDVDLLATGVAAWEAASVPGVRWLPFGCAWGTGAKVEIDGAAYPWGIEAGEGVAWQPAAKRHIADDARSRNDRVPRQALRPGLLPAQLDEPRQAGRVRLVASVESDQTQDIPIRALDDIEDEHEMWQALVDDARPVTIPAHTKRRVLIDLEQYYCAYPELTLTGGAGASVRLAWQEALFDSKKPWSKGHRSVVEGKYFCMIWHDQPGVFDRFLGPGGRTPRTFSTPWWQCGRYIEVVVETGEQPLTIDGLSLRETRYPLENEGAFGASDPKLAALIPMMVRAMQMCAHETYFDCPFYEQLMYAGDTRLEVLTTYVLTRDDRLPRKAVTMFDVSRLTTGLVSGLTQSRYPGHILQIIPPFSLWWVGMVHDWALWKGDRGVVRERLTGVRAVLDAWTARRDEAGRIVSPSGWNYVDWVPDWDAGTPRGGDAGNVSGVHNWHVAYTLMKAAELEDMVGEPEFAARCRRVAAEVAAACEAFWDEGRGLYANDTERTQFSEHANCLALLSGLAPEDRRERIAAGILDDPDLARTTIYYSHYLFETFFLIGRPDRFFERLSLWHGLLESGFMTTVESPEPSRSDCHAWGAHPLFHFHASVLGVRPSSPGFATVRVAPQLGALEWARGALPHPQGEVRVDLRRHDGKLTGRVTLPDAVTGTFVDGERVVALTGGGNDV